MTGSARPRWRRVLLAVAALAALTLPVPVASAAPGHRGNPVPAPPTAPRAMRSRTPAPGNGATTIGLVDQPAWVGPNSPVSVTVKIANPPPGGRLLTTLYDRVPDRAALQRSLFAQFGKPITPNGLSSASLDGLPRDTNGALTDTVSFALSDTTSEPPAVIYVVSAGGVYPLDLQVLDRSGKQVARLVTWIVCLPAAAAAQPGGAPLDVALVLPLHAAPSHRPDGSVAVTADARDRTRRLVQALTGASGTPFTLAPTPELLDSLASSTTTDDNGLLAQLRLLAAAPGRAVLTGPYVDADLPAWLRQPTLRDRATVEWSRGEQAIQAQLGVAPLDATAVAPNDLTNDMVSWLYDAGVRRVVASPGALGQEVEPPVRPFTLSNGTGAALQAVAVDATSQFGFGLDDSRLGLQEILAGLAQTALDAPSGPAGTVLAPPLDTSQWSADPQRLTALLQALTVNSAGPDTKPLVQLVPLTQLFQPPPAGTGTPVVLHAPNVDPPSLADFDQHLAAAQKQLASFRQMLVTSAGSPGSPNLGLVRASAYDQLLGIAGAQELTPTQRDQFLDGVVASLHQELGGVAAPSHQTVTLTSRSGSIPLTLHNTLGYPVQVRVQMESSERLVFPDGTTQQLTLNGENTPLEIRVRTRTSGDAPLTISVTSPDGSLVLATTDYTVRSTAVSGVGLALTIGAALVLLVWWVRSWHRSRRAKRTRPADLLPSP